LDLSTRWPPATRLLGHYRGRTPTGKSNTASEDALRPATFIAHPPRLRNGPLMDIGLRHAEPARPDRHASHAQPTAAEATACHVFLGSRIRLRLPSHRTHGVAVAIDLWLVPSTSTGDLHPRTAGHAGRTRVAGTVARPGSHRTVRTLFVYGSSGRQVANPAAGRFATSKLSP